MNPNSSRKSIPLPLLVAGCFVLAFTTFVLWRDHQSHLAQAAPYLILLLCPALHFLMHRGHGSQGGSKPGPSQEVHHGSKL